MEAEIPERVDQFLELLAEWTVELFHIEGRPMDFGQDGGNCAGRNNETDLVNTRGGKRGNGQCE